MLIFLLFLSPRFSVLYLAFKVGVLTESQAWMVGLVGFLLSLGIQKLQDIAKGK